jgi:nucleotide-binding universal stress UspA family protein
VIVMRLSPQHDSIAPGVADWALGRIVVGIDFTETSLAAAAWASRHLARGATLTLVHVVTPPPLPNVSRLQSDRTPEPGSRLQARVRSMRGALRGLGGAVAGTSTTVEVRVGDPAVQLARYANMVAADLLVVGGNAVFRASSIRGTATTDRLLRQLARPGLVVRNGRSALRTVLVALADATMSSVLAVARTLAAPSGARVVTLRLADTVPAGSRRLSTNSHDTLAKEEQVRMINDVAGELRADVIVIGSDTSATGADDDDVARLLARTAERSVLVVPRPTERWSRRLHLDIPGTWKRSRPIA